MTDLWRRPPSCKHELEFFKGLEHMNHLQPVSNFNVTEGEVLSENGVFDSIQTRLAPFTNKTGDFMKIGEHDKHHYLLYTVSKIPLQK
jgi:hypothetical protein